jgi:hypothetical protein
MKTAFFFQGQKCVCARSVVQYISTHSESSKSVSGCKKKKLLVNEFPWKIILRLLSLPGVIRICVRLILPCRNEIFFLFLKMRILKRKLPSDWLDGVSDRKSSSLREKATVQSEARLDVLFLRGMIEIQ